MHLQRRLLARKVNELEESLRLNEMFVAVLGHDLRTPLSVVQNGAEIISRFSTSDPSRLEKTAQTMLSSTKRMNDMVNQLLDVARTRSNSFTLNLGRYDYAEVVSQIVQEFSSAERPEIMMLTTEGDTSGEFDKTRMFQVFSNLIGNAYQHGTPGETIELSVDGSSASQVGIEVVSQGTIPSTILENIFDPFRTMSTQQPRNPAGLGLGLYIVKQFVTAHGGSVTVHSKDGRTKFRVVVPRSIDYMNS